MIKTLLHWGLKASAIVRCDNRRTMVAHYTPGTCDTLEKKFNAYWSTCREIEARGQLGGRVLIQGVRVEGLTLFTTHLS